MGRFSKLEPGKLKKVAAKFYAGEEDEESYDAQEYYIKGAQEYFGGCFDKAVRCYSRALQMDNARIECWVGQIYALLAMRQYKEADLWAGQGLMLFPDNADLVSLRGVTYAHKGFIKRAIGSSDYALQQGISPDVWISRGEILLFAKNKNSFFCFEKAMEISPDSWQAPFKIGMIFYRHRIHSTALKYLTKACNLNQNNHYLWYLIGKSNLFLKQKSKSLEAFKRSVEIASDFTPSKRMLSPVKRFSVFKSLFALPKKIFGKG